MSLKGKYKVTYFNGRGRGEPIRLALAAAGVEFEDKRVEQEEWDKIKSDTPMGYMPILEVDGEQLMETPVLIGYLGKEFGLHGKNNVDSAKVDMMVAMLCNFDTSMYEALMSPAEKKEAEMKKFLEETFENFPGKFEKLAGSSWLVGDNMTVADLTLFNTNQALGMVKLSLDKYPKLAAIVKKVEADPKVAGWLERRPKSDW